MTPPVRTREPIEATAFRSIVPPSILTSGLYLIKFDRCWDSLFCFWRSKYLDQKRRLQLPFALDKGQYRRFAGKLAEYTGNQLTQLSQEEFEALVPGDTGLLLYGALLAKQKKSQKEAQESSSGLGVGAASGTSACVAVIVVIICCCCCCYYA